MTAREWNDHMAGAADGTAAAMDDKRTRPDTVRGSAYTDGWWAGWQRTMFALMFNPAQGGTHYV